MEILYLLSHIKFIIQHNLIISYDRNIAFPYHLIFKIHCNLKRIMDNFCHINIFIIQMKF